MNNFEKLVNLIKNCSKCDKLVIDKPCIRYKVYREYMPPRPIILVVSESPPPGMKRDYLYNVNHKDRLRLALAKTFNVEEAEVLEYLRDKHILWSTAIKCRPRSKDYIKSLRVSCLPILRAELELIQPAVAVTLGITAISSFKDLGIKPHYIGYHPLYYMRTNRLNELRTILNAAISKIST